MIVSRRNFFGILAAPAVLRIIQPMKLWVPEAEAASRPNSILTPEMIAKEAVWLFKASNAFLREWDATTYGITAGTVNGAFQ